MLGENSVILGDNLDVLPGFEDEAFQLIYIDPPFNTGKTQTRKTLQAVPDEGGDRIGFMGRRYRTRLLAESSYLDEFDDYLAFLEPRLREAHRLLASSGTLYFHIDYREAHYCKLLLDEIFGRKCFLNEIIWAYDYGARSRRRWPAKHDTILVYVKDPLHYHYDDAAVDREPYMAPGLVTRGEGGEGQAADRRVVAHDRSHQRSREDRLPHAEARGHRAAHDPGLDAPGRLVPGLLRRQRHARSGRREAGQAICDGRLQSRGRARDPRTAEGRGAGANAGASCRPSA